MKKWIVALIVLCLVLLSSSAQGNEPNMPKDEAVTLWVTGNSPAYENTNIGVMLGYLKNDIEIGGAVDWRQWSEGDTADDTQSNFALGFYGILHFPEIVDVNTPFNLPWLPEKLASEPCLGMAYLFDVKTTGNEKGVNTPVFAALRIFDLFVLRYEIDVFHSIDIKDDSKFGLSLQYRF